MTRFVLDFDDFDEDEFTLYGIQTNLIEEYKFIYHLNKNLNIRFQRIDDLDIKIDNEILCFPTYLYEDNINSKDYYIISNLSNPKEKNTLEDNLLFNNFKSQHYLLKKYKFYNYFLKVNTKTPLESSFEVSLQRLSFINHLKLIDQLNINEKKLITI